MFQIIQGYAIEIFADVYTHKKSGIRHGESIDKVIRFYVFVNTSGFATTHVVVSVRHPITY